MTEKSIVRSVTSYLKDEYDDRSRLIYPEAIHKSWRRPDVLFVEGRRDRLHIIEAEPTWDRCFDPAHGFRQVRRLPANYRWVAIPEAEFCSAEHDLLDESRRTGIGIMLVYGCAVEEYVQPCFLPGQHLHHYFEADGLWPPC
jgi:hypothetical protein